MGIVAALPLPLSGGMTISIVRGFRWRLRPTARISSRTVGERHGAMPDIFMFHIMTPHLPMKTCSYFTMQSPQATTADATNTIRWDGSILSRRPGPRRSIRPAPRNLSRRLGFIRQRRPVTNYSYIQTLRREPPEAVRSQAACRELFPPRGSIRFHWPRRSQWWRDSGSRLFYG